MEEELKSKTEESIQKILKDGITTNNLDHLYKLSKINHIAKEDKEMYGEYGEYGARRGGRRGSYGEYGNYGEYGRGSYGARGRGRYRGDDEMDRMSDEYGRYQESRQRYGAGEETDKSFHYMVKSLEDFIRVFYEKTVENILNVVETQGK